MRTKKSFVRVAEVTRAPEDGWGLDEGGSRSNYSGNKDREVERATPVQGQRSVDSLSDPSWTVDRDAARTWSPSKAKMNHRP